MRLQSETNSKEEIKKLNEEIGKLKSNQNKNNDLAKEVETLKHSLANREKESGSSLSVLEKEVESLRYKLTLEQAAKDSLERTRHDNEQELSQKVKDLESANDKVKKSLP